MTARDATAASLEVEIRHEIDRYNARLRQCSNVAAGVVEQALGVWEELWAECQDPRSPEEIIDGNSLASGDLPLHGWPDFLQRLHLLGYYLDYIRRLLDGCLNPEIEPPQVRTK